MKLTDHEKLASVRINKPQTPFLYTIDTGNAGFGRRAVALDSILLPTQTAAFLIIRNDTILYERYFNGFNEYSLLPSQSMAKSFVSTLVGMALADGAIGSLSDPVTKYLPELGKREARFHLITLQHLLDMRSGIDYTEGTYTLKDDGVRLGFRPNLEKHILKSKIAAPPGEFKYQSINTMLLGLVLERSTKKRLAAYLEEKLWQPLGMESNATWNVDSKRRQREIASSAINAVARDFAKLGTLFLNKGEWNDLALMPSKWASVVSSIDTMQQYGGYKNQWWSRRLVATFKDSSSAQQFKNEHHFADAVMKDSAGYRVSFLTEAFNASGFLNQAIYVHPRKQLVIVRLGRRWQHPQDFNQFLYTLGEAI